MRPRMSPYSTLLQADGFGIWTVRTRRSPIKRGWGREGVRSEARAQQRLAPGGAQRSPNPYEVSLLLVEGFTAGRARRHGGQWRGGLERVGGAAARTAAGWASGADQVAAAAALPAIGQLADEIGA